MSSVVEGISFTETGQNSGSELVAFAQVKHLMDSRLEGLGQVMVKNNLAQNWNQNFIM